MRILFVVDNPTATDVIRNAMSDIAEKDSIYFVYSFPDAEDFINKKVIDGQEPLDLIITHNAVNGKIALEFRLSLTADSTRIYSNRDFNLDKLPVILMIKPSENINFFNKQGFSDIVFDMGAEQLPKTVPIFQNSIRTWRKKVIDELDNLGIPFNSGIVDYNYYIKKVKRYIPTRIISDNFQLIPRKLHYYWLNHNLRQIELAIDEYSKLLNRTHRNNPKREEKLYHKFFNRNESFLLRDNYSRKWYEKMLPLNERHSYQPDFSLKPNMNYKTDLNILEIKLPNEGFIKNTHFHPTFYSKFIEHLSQIQDYKDYLENEEYREIIKKQYGWFPERIQYSLLMGRESEKEENLEILTKRMRQFAQGNIYLMTYDELLTYQVRYLDRMNLLEIY